MYISLKKESFQKQIEGNWVKKLSIVYIYQKIVSITYFSTCFTTLSKIRSRHHQVVVFLRAHTFTFLYINFDLSLNEQQYLCISINTYIEQNTTSHGKKDLIYVCYLMLHIFKKKTYYYRIEDWELLSHKRISFRENWSFLGSSMAQTVVVIHCFGHEFAI